MKRILITYLSIVFATATAVNVCYAQIKPLVVSDVKIKALIKKMTLEEKIAMLHANAKFSSAGVKRLGIPQLMSDDGPLGVREEVRSDWSPAELTTDSATFFPNGSAVAATWNPTLANRFGVALGEETRARHKDVMLAPGINITRTPLNGRTYEYYSEDPFLNAQLVVAAVKGIQTQGVAACVKHYAVNNQESERRNVNAVVDERTLQEIYLPAFKAAITKGNAWVIMTAYNKFRGVYCAENEYLLNNLLRKQWGFKGVVMSDWGGTHSSVASAKNGLDVEMGTDKPYEEYYYAKPLLDSVKMGFVSQKLIDEKVYHILWVMYHTAMNSGKPAGSTNTPAHSKTAYDVAAEAIVLLKNEKHLLPLNTSTIKSLAVIGDNAIQVFHKGGIGAGVKARYEVTNLQGLKNKFGSKVDIQFAQGYKPDFKQTYTDEKKVQANKPNAEMIAQAVALAKTKNAAIVFIGGNRDYESEGHDRITLALPFGEQQLVDAVSAVNANTIVVMVGGAPYDLNAIKKNNHTIVWQWYNGAEEGNALANVLSGKVNPSGKMPFTFPAKLDDSPGHALHTFPYDKNLTADYKEGLLVGYRWFDTKSIEPLYPFGYGLSYTNYVYTNAATDKPSYKQSDKIMLTVTVKNNGKYSGKEVVQLYVAKPNSKVTRPEKELKGFAKVWVGAGKQVKVTIPVNVSDLAFFNDKTMKWEVEKGEYKLLVAASSKDIRQTKLIAIN
jgi:beta-glucosidase